MKKTKRLWALLLVMVMALGLISTAFAAPTIDSGRKASLSLYKYDITAASEDGAWNTASYVSTGVQDDAVTDKLAQYAIQGVEFTYLRVADIAMNNELVDGQRQVGVLYGFAEGTVLQAIGLTAADAHKSENGTRYYTADKLNKAMSDALTANATTVKNALEAAARNGGKAMPETDENGHSKVSGLEQGLYLVVETRVPENVTSTCNPFFVSLPMTTIDGKGWNYDVTVYPKNQTGNPTLEKTVREAAADTGKNGGTGDIADGYAAQRGGHAISFVQQFYGKSYPEAVTMLLGRDGQSIIPIAKQEPEPQKPKPFALPKSYLTMRRMYAYLTKHRCIDRDVVTAFVQEKLLYEDDPHHNCVFVGLDENGEARHAHLRSTGSQGKVFRINVEGSDIKHSFHKNGTDRSLYVFEAPIDLLSHITLYPAGWLEHSYVACCGTSIQPVLERLRQNPKLDTVYLCLDNDEAGEDACDGMLDTLEDMGYDVERLRPEGKDWNDDLRAKRGGHG